MYTLYRSVYHICSNDDPTFFMIWSDLLPSTFVMGNVLKTNGWKSQHMTKENKTFIYHKILSPGIICPCLCHKC